MMGELEVLGGRQPNCMSWVMIMLRYQCLVARVSGFTVAASGASIIN